jgi:hypothetical protein
LSKLKPKFRKPMNVAEILEELYDNKPRLKYIGAVDVEPDVTLKKGRKVRFCFQATARREFSFSRVRQGRRRFRLIQ